MAPMTDGGLPIQSRLCSFCRFSQFSGSQLFGLHHRDIHTLRTSCQDCDVCESVYGALFDLDELRSDLTLPIYRWSIRRPVASKECEDEFILIFRQRGAPTESNLKEHVFCILPESVLYFPAVNEIGASTDSAASYAQVKMWMAECQDPTKHPKCNKNPQTSFTVPARLLKVDSSDETSIRLVETSKPMDTGPPYRLYCTLSHCWGKDRVYLQLKRESKQRFCTSGIQLSELSKTWQEAIHVTRKLGIPYLWIDSMCIVQDDDEDWKHQSSQMHDIYRHAIFNVAAADAADGDGGLFRYRLPPSILPAGFDIPTRTNVFVEGRWAVVKRDWWETELLQCSLYTRAWVFQERMLAQRVIHYGQAQIFWDCAQISACETLPKGLPHMLDQRAAVDRLWRLRLHDSVVRGVAPLAGPANSSLEAFWKVAVESYTKCDLTFHKDKLLALNGVTVLVQAAMDDYFHAGLWRSHFVEQLAWRVVDGKCGNGVPSKRPETPRKGKEFKFPSWSWASLEGVIDVPVRINHKRTYEVKRHNGGVLVSNLETKPILERKTFPPIESQEWKDRIKQMTIPEEMIQKRQNSSAISTSKISSAIGSQSPDPTGKNRTEVLTYDERALEMTCRWIGISALQVRPGPWSWTFSIKPSKGTIDVFPDFTPKEAASQTFCILAATENDTDLDESWYIDGIGLLLDPVPSSLAHFTRSGSFRFSGLNRASWKDLQDLCKQSHNNILRQQNEDNEWNIYIR